MLKKVKYIFGIITLAGGLLAIVLDFNQVWAMFQEPVDITGEWEVTFNVDETTHQDYLGDEHKYTIYFIQEGNTIIGDGEKYWYNGKDLPSTSHTPISISGKCLGDSIVCKYTLKGSKRETTGNFTVYHDNGQISGHFSGTAASSKGRVKGKKR